MSERLTIVMNALTKAPSQYINVPFESVVEFNGQLLYLGEDGVFAETGATDDGRNISAWIDTPNLDLGNPHQKRVEAFDVGYEADGFMQLTLIGDERVPQARTFTLPLVVAGQRQQGGRQTLRQHRFGLARYWKVRIANFEGCDFSLDYLALAPVTHRRGPMR